MTIHGFELYLLGLESQSDNVNFKRGSNCDFEASSLYLSRALRFSSIAEVDIGVRNDEYIDLGSRRLSLSKRCEPGSRCLDGDEAEVGGMMSFYLR